MEDKILNITDLYKATLALNPKASEKEQAFMVRASLLSQQVVLEMIAEFILNEMSNEEILSCLAVLHNGIALTLDQEAHKTEDLH